MTDVKDKGDSLFLSWFVLNIWRMRRKRKYVKNLKSTLLDEKINEVPAVSLANAQDLRQEGYLQVTQRTRLCISTKNGSLYTVLLWNWGSSTFCNFNKVRGGDLNKPIAVSGKLLFNSLTIFTSFTIFSSLKISLHGQFSPLFSPFSWNL